MKIINSNNLENFSFSTKDQEILDKSNPLYLQDTVKNNNENNKYIEKQNPVQSQINLPENNLVKNCEVDKTIDTEPKSTPENLYANPFTYQGGVPGFLPNSPTRLKKQDLLSNRHKYSDKNFIDNTLKGWNWGAFYFTFIWGFFNTRWYIGILMFFIEWGFLYVLINLGHILFKPGIFPVIFIPCGANLIYKILLGIFGNKLSWSLKNWNGIENFAVAQEQWRFFSGLIYAFLVIAYISLGLMNTAGCIFYIPGLIYLLVVIATLFVH